MIISPEFRTIRYKLLEAIDKLTGVKETIRLARVMFSHENAINYGIKTPAEDRVDIFRRLEGFCNGIESLQENMRIMYDEVVVKAPEDMYMTFTPDGECHRVTKEEYDKIFAHEEEAFKNPEKTNEAIAGITSIIGTAKSE